MSSPTEFDKEMQQLAKEFETGVEKTVRKAALAADQTVVLATPVDKGTARSNWTVNLNAAASGVREAYSPGQNLGIGETGNAQGALAQGRAVINTFKLGKDKSIHITNNLPYIERLNEGHSAQAPAGFVDEAVQAAVNAVTRAKIL